MKGKIKIRCTKCREFKWVPKDIVDAKIARRQKKLHKPNAGYVCTKCL